MFENTNHDWKGDLQGEQILKRPHWSQTPLGVIVLKKTCIFITEKSSLNLETQIWVKHLCFCCLLIYSIGGGTEVTSFFAFVWKHFIVILKVKCVSAV